MKIIAEQNRIISPEIASKDFRYQLCYILERAPTE